MTSVLVYGLAVTARRRSRALHGARHRRGRRRRHRRRRDRRGLRRRRSASTWWSRPTIDELARLIAAVRHRRAGARRARGPPCRPRPLSTRAGASSASSSWPTSGSSSDPAARGRCWPSPAPTARPPPRCWRSRCCAPPGRRTVAAGNTEVPLVEAIDLDLDVFVVECTSFRLAFTSAFRADAAAWLNLAPDHLNWHRDLASYTDAKASIFANQRPDDVAIGLVDDPEVMRHLRRAPARHVTFGASGADYHVSGAAASAVLTGPGGPIAAVRAMARVAAPRPHQRARRVGARARDGAGRSRRRGHGARRVPRSAAPHRARRRGRRRGLVRRLQGHHATRRLRGDPRLRPRRAHRRRAEQGPRPHADDGHP